MTKEKHIKNELVWGEGATIIMPKRKTGMKRARMLQLAEQAGFIMWSDCEWKPKGATIDWASEYDKELRKFTKLVEAECSRPRRVKIKVK